MLAPWKKSYDKPRQCIKKQRYRFANKGPCSQSYDFSSSYVRLWELDHKEGWALKNWCFQIVPEKTLESPLDSKETQPVSPKGNQPSIFIGRTDAEAEAPIIWPPDVKSWLIGKDSDVKVWKQEEKGATEDEMVGWHHQHDGHEFEQTLGDSEGQGSLVCCCPWGHKESDATEWLNNNNKPAVVPLAVKAMKLFFSTSPKTLSLRFNSVSGYRGWIWLHILWSETERTSGANSDKEIRSLCLEPVGHLAPWGLFGI